MGFDHSFDFEIAIPALVAYLRRNNQIRFELFGSIPKPAALEEFGDRIGVIPPVRNYESFLKAFSELGWDIGITPLQPTPFNLLKADTKWVEYTSIGAAVIASRGTVYDECCSGGCGLLATTADEWLQALEKLTRDPAERFAQVRRAQEKLLKEYSVERLRDQVLEMFSRAKTDRSTQPSEADTVRTSG